MALGAPMPTLLAVFAIGGLGAGFLNPIIAAVIYERVPERSRGRIISLTGAIDWGLMPLGSPLGGILAHFIGLQLTLMICGGVYLIVTLLPIFMRDLQRV